MMEMKSLFLVHSDHDHHHDHDYDRKVQQTHHVKHHSEIQHEKCQNDASHPLLLSLSRALGFRLRQETGYPSPLMEMKSLFLVNSDYDRKVQQTHQVRHHSEVQQTKVPK
ncbi:hypothetical protein FNV43_RR05943 [Rhamnella rubrinervis]|uniref:Uncharacterized protein n=1 Tax=Rhamnella rubrinervis TaxID=2594499 RepID=A0A8K0HDJ1_9ROSA|nr:hypothetical protein FNV43_RR05943 [Rhamnella rubrinervis]